jgi:hypothetical protein
MFHIRVLDLYDIKAKNQKLIHIISMNSVRTSKRTQHFTITEITWLMVFKKIIAVYSENHMKPVPG